MLRCINRLTEPDEGKILLAGTVIFDRTNPISSKIDINKVRSQIGMVFQHFNLFAHLNVLNNVCIGLIKVKKMKKRDAVERAKHEITRVGLADKINAYPGQLSGGQQQRVSIARALAMEPKLLLFDEPTSALDPELIGEVVQVMIDLSKAGMTMLCVTHEIGFARTMADEIIFIDEGNILEQAPPNQIFTNPKHKRIGTFLGKISELYGEKV